MQSIHKLIDNINTCCCGPRPNKPSPQSSWALPIEQVNANMRRQNESYLSNRDSQQLQMIKEEDFEFERFEEHKKSTSRAAHEELFSSFESEH